MAAFAPRCGQKRGPMSGVWRAKWLLWWLLYGFSHYVGLANKPNKQLKYGDIFVKSMAQFELR